MSVEHGDARIQHFFPIRAQSMNGQHAVETGSGFGPCVHEIGPAVVIPQGTGVDPALGLLHQLGRIPGPGRIFTLDHKNAQIRIAVIDPVLVPVKTQTGRPDAVAVLYLVIARRRQPLQCMADDLPVDQVARVQHRQTGYMVETGGDQVEIIADSNDIRIGIVGKEDGIGIVRYVLLYRQKNLHQNHAGRGAQRPPCKRAGEIPAIRRRRSAASRGAQPRPCVVTCMAHAAQRRSDGVMILSLTAVRVCRPDAESNSPTGRKAENLPECPTAHRRAD